MWLDDLSNEVDRLVFLMEGPTADEKAEAQPNNLMELAADLVAAYVSKNNVPVSVSVRRHIE